MKLKITFLGNSAENMPELEAKYIDCPFDQTEVTDKLKIEFKDAIKPFYEMFSKFGTSYEYIAESYQQQIENAIKKGLDMDACMQDVQDMIGDKFDSKRL